MSTSADEMRRSVRNVAIMSILEEVAAAVPDRVAIAWPVGDRIAEITYAELQEDAWGLARRLRGLVAPGERVAVWAANCADWLILEYAAAAASVTLVPLNTALTDEEALHQLEASQARVLFCAWTLRGAPLFTRASALALQLSHPCVVVDLEGWPALPESQLEIVAPDPHRPFLIQYTSGTTGRPKGAVLTQYAAFNAAALSSARLEPGASEIWCSAMPMHHVGGSVSVALSILAMAGTIVLMPSFDAGETIRLAARTRATIIGGVPTMMTDVLDHPSLVDHDLSSVRVVLVGGSNVAPSLIGRIETTLGARVVNAYGQSEAPNTAQTSLGADDLDKAETIGTANPGHEVKVIDIRTGSPAPVGGSGELCIRSPFMMSGYHDDPMQTSEAIDSDGWLHTGDLVSVDERAILRFTGRLRDVIISGGENIYPAEVEAILTQHPQVADVAVVAGPDDRWGEVPVAFVRLAPGAQGDLDAIEAFGRASLAAFKVPKRWIAVTEFPLTASGKVQRYVLRDRLARHAAAGAGMP